VENLKGRDHLKTYGKRKNIRMYLEKVKLGVVWSGFMWIGREPGGWRY
jgi:hypothetical protein